MASCKTDDLIGNTDDDRQKQQLKPDTHPYAVPGEQGKNEDGNDEHNQQKAGAAARVKPDVFFGVFRRQFVAGLITGNRFMLRAVIFKHAVDIRHARDRKQIKHKYGDFKHAFNQRQNCGGRGGQGAGIFDDRGWQEHKQAHGNQYGKDGDKDIKNPYGAFAQMRVHPFVKFGRFLILGEAGQLR